jgi:hypothetical protein
VATTLVFGEQIAVIAALGFNTLEFTLDSSQLDSEDVLDGTIEGVDVSPYVRSLNISQWVAAISSAHSVLARCTHGAEQ